MVVLHPMSETDFAGFLAYFIPDYAAEIAANYHLSQDAALAQAKREIAASLPDGVKTQGQSLKSIVHTDNGSEVQIGYLWYRANGEDQSAFIYDFYLLPAFRGKGSVAARCKVWRLCWQAKVSGKSNYASPPKMRMPKSL
jgi:hypothetical protein